MLYFFSVLKYNAVINQTTPPGKKGTKIMKKLFASILAILMVISCFAACGKAPATPTTPSTDAATDAPTEASKAITVGYTIYAPMNYLDEAGNLIGFDTDLAKAVFEGLGYTVIFQEIDWTQKYTDLESGAIDCVWNGMTITDALKQSMDITDAYVKNAQVVVMAADKVADYADAASMAELNFAVESGSAGEAAAKDNSFEYTAVLTQADALMEVKAGTSDAAAGGTVSRKDS